MIIDIYVHHVVYVFVLFMVHEHIDMQYKVIGKLGDEHKITLDILTNYINNKIDKCPTLDMGWRACSNAIWLIE